MKLSQSNDVAKALAKAGIVDDINSIQRIVIDLCAGQPAQVYVQRVGGPELAELLPRTLVDVAVVDSAAKAGKPPWAEHGPDCAPPA